MGLTPARLLTRSDVERLVDIRSCIDGVENAFRLKGEGRPSPGGILGVPVAGGGFHAKAAMLELSRPYFAVKINANFPENPANQARAMKRLGIIVPLVLVLIASLLYASFGNVRHALLVMLNVPFALVGGIAALWVRGLDINLSASVGFIALFGVAVLTESCCSPTSINCANGETGSEKLFTREQRSDFVRYS